VEILIFVNINLTNIVTIDKFLKVFMMIKYKIIDFQASEKSQRVLELATNPKVKLILPQTEIEIVVPQFSDSIDYERSSPVVGDTLAHRVKLGHKDGFIDFGCGKGEIIRYIATEKRLKIVVGVDIVRTLVQTAAKKTAYNTKRKSPVTIYQMDATLFTELDEITVAYFYYPFGPATFQAVMKNVWQSLQKNPRYFRIIYYAPSYYECDVLKSLERKTINDRLFQWEYFPGKNMVIHTDEIPPSGLKSKIALVTSRWK